MISIDNSVEHFAQTAIHESVRQRTVAINGERLTLSLGGPGRGSNPRQELARPSDPGERVVRMTVEADPPDGEKIPLENRWYGIRGMKSGTTAVGCLAYAGASKCNVLAHNPEVPAALVTNSLNTLPSNVAQAVFNQSISPEDTFSFKEMRAGKLGDTSATVLLNGEMKGWVYVQNSLALQRLMNQGDLGQKWVMLFLPQELGEEAGWEGATGFLEGKEMPIVWLSMDQSFLPDVGMKAQRDGEGGAGVLFEAGAPFNFQVVGLNQESGVILDVKNDTTPLDLIPEAYRQHFADDYERSRADRNKLFIGFAALGGLASVLNFLRDTNGGHAEKEEPEGKAEKPKPLVGEIAWLLAKVGVDGLLALVVLSWGVGKKIKAAAKEQVNKA